MRQIQIAAIAALGMISAACSSPEAKVEKYYASGQEFLESGEYGKANVQFQNVLKIDETHVPTLIGMAEIAESKQNLKAMFGLYQRVVRLDANNTFAHIQLGKLYLIGSDESAALESAETALKLEPTSVDAIALKSGVLLRLGDTEGAVRLARQAVAVQPAHVEATTVLATVRGMSGDMEGAIGELDRALNVDPKIAVLQLLRIQILAQLGRDEDVLEGFSELVKLFPEEPAYRRAYAMEFIKRKNFAGAREQMEILVGLDVDNNEAKLDVVRIVNAKDGAEAAEDRLRAFVEEFPKNQDLRFALIDLLHDRGALDESIAALDPLMKSDDEAVVLRAKNKLAVLYLREGDRDKAEALVNEILDADGNNTDALIRRASFLLDDGEYDTGVADLRTALNNNPDLVEAMVLMSSAFERQDNIDFARAELAKAFETSGKTARVANIYAKFLTRHGDSRRAEDILVQSLAVFSGDLDNLKLLAAVRLDIQDWQGADEIAAIISSLDVAAENDLASQIRTVALSGLGDYDQIIDMLTAQNKSAPLESRPLAMLVSAYLKADRIDEAEQLLKNVIASDANNYAAYVLLARAYGAREDAAAGEAILLEAIDVEPSRGEAFEILYRYNLARGERDKAIALIEDGIRRAPDNAALKFFKADYLVTAGKLEAAFEIYSDLIEERPSDRIIANNFVSLSSDLRKDKKSIARALEVARVLEKDETALVQDTVGWAHYRAGQYDRALEFLTKAAAETNNGEIFYHLGAAQIAAGEAEAGRASLNKALEVGGENFRFEPEVRVLLNQQ
ncbi:MAG: tetratricopeptide repeat protein [Alphaproteobacteria bacterium]|nr:tetratricopeptide repeat protein [Alphaproteobacteria bacterium]